MADMKEEALKCYFDEVSLAVENFLKHKNLFIFYLNIEQAKCQADIILNMPKFAEGGIVPANTRTGDIITIPTGEIKLNGKMPEGYIIRVDTGKPGGDHS